MRDSYLPNEEFYSLDFYVTIDVLTPRNETEILVDKTLGYLKGLNDENIDYIDVGTGSGCIPISIYKNTDIKFNQIKILDISPKALNIANINLQQHELSSIIEAKKSDLLNIFIKNKDNTLGINTNTLLLTANLPYIRDDDLENIDMSILENDPLVALFGGPKTGFELYERLFAEILKIKDIYNYKNIILFIEIGFDQYDYSKKYLDKLGLKYSFFKDYLDVYRVIKIDF